MCLLGCVSRYSVILQKQRLASAADYPDFRPMVASGGRAVECLAIGCFMFGVLEWDCGVGVGVGGNGSGSGSNCWAGVSYSERMPPAGMELDIPATASGLDEIDGIVPGLLIGWVVGWANDPIRFKAAPATPWWQWQRQWWNSFGWIFPTGYDDDDIQGEEKKNRDFCLVLPWSW
jgi:hypothetical protein